MRHQQLQEVLRCTRAVRPEGTRRRCVALQQQQAKTIVLSPINPQLPEGSTDTLIGEDGQPREYIGVNLEGGSGALATNFVWQPGGVATDGVYTTWAALAPALAAVPGAKTVSVDTSIAAAHITAGGPYNLQDVTFVGALLTTIAAINIDVGVTFTASTTDISLVRAAFVNNATATVWSPTSSASVSMDTGEVVSTAAGAFIACASGTVNFIMRNGSLIGDGTHTVATVGAAGTFNTLTFTGSAIQANAITGSAGGSVGVTYDGSCIINTTQGAGPTYGFDQLDPTTAFVFMPGATGTTNGNVFTTWASLMAASAQVTGSKHIYIDDSLATANTSAGTFSLEGVYLNSKRQGGGATLHIVEGTVFTNTTRFIIDDSLTVSCDATATVPIVSSAAVNPLLRPQLRAACIVKSTAGIALFQKSAGGSLAFQISLGSTLGDGTHNVVTVDAGQSVSSLCVAGVVAAHAFGGAGTATFSADSASTVSATQDTGVTTITFASLASQVAYTAGTAGNWNPTPTLVNTALDQLAASNTKTGTGNTGTGTGAVSVTSAAITKAKNGHMQVSASCLCSTSAAATLTLQLQRDAATNIGTAKTVVAGAAITAVDLTIDAIDTAPDNAAHTYNLNVTASAGNITVAANSAQIQVVEDS